MPFGFAQSGITVKRFCRNPIIVPNMDARMGDNINGPSLIRVPDWIPNPLGRYYLYFAHHTGSYIRLAYADFLEGPWSIHTPGALDLEATPFSGHIASPDVHVDKERKEIRMYYHGVHEGSQKTAVAISRNGIDFASGTEVLGPFYFRVFTWKGFHYATAMPSRLYRSRDGLTPFARGPMLLADVDEMSPGVPRTRHSALLVTGDTLNIFHSRKQDMPEHILLSRVHLSGDWMTWKSSGDPESVLFPECDYEGGRLPPARSENGLVNGPVHQLRDPAIFQEGGRTYLLYSVAGENGIAIAELLI